MNNKAFTISLVLAGLAVFMIYSYISSKEDELKRTYGDEVSVAVAKRSIKEMEVVYENMVDTVVKPKKFVEPGSATSKQEVLGFIATVPIRKGEQVTLNKIISPGVRTGLARQISPGKRAISIPVTDDTAVSKLIKPGDRIDLLTTLEVPGAQRGMQITKMVLQDVPVLAVGEYISNLSPRKAEKDKITGQEEVRNLNAERNFNTITIEVEPQWAAQITLLRDAGHRLSVLLRNNDDTERVNIGGVMLMDVIGQDLGRVVRTPASQR
jgi:pilus assembly protein CpaB